jgi:surfactin synthase thioesterase subunit
LRLFCFPYAGAGASIYFSWNTHFRSYPVELCFVQLPGHESRLREPPVARLGPLIEGLLPALQPWLDLPFCFFGHSMGTLVSFEAMRELRRRGWPLPARAFMSGSPPPNVRSYANISHLGDDALLAALAGRYAQIPDGLMDHPGLRELVMPAIRADLGVIESYTFQPEEPLDVPLTVLGGLSDPSTPIERLTLWSDHTRHPLKTRLVPGGHFYIRPPPRELLQIVTADLGVGPG